MAERLADASPTQRLRAIEERQDRLMAELDGLNDRIEAALERFSTRPAEAATA